MNYENIYHVIVRGNNRKEVFRNDEDKRKYLWYISKYKKQDNFKLIAYAIMDNHTHLLIQQDDKMLSKTMQKVQLSYSKYFNRKYNHTGHVFERAYKKIKCENERYLFTLVKYVHDNPKKVGNDIEKYIYCSHKDYLSENNTIVDTEILLYLLDYDENKAYKIYNDNMN